MAAAVSEGGEDTGRNRAGARWGASFIAVACLHAGAVAAAVTWVRPMAAAISPPPVAMMIDLAPAAPAMPAASVPEPEPEVRKLPEPVRKAEVELPMPPQKPKPPQKPEPRREEKPREQKQAPRPPVPAPVHAAVVRAPAAAPSAARPVLSAMEQAASRSYLSELLGHLERHKRYPYSAQRRREEGIVYLSFAMDRQGRVLSARIHKSSGYGALDSEVEAMIHRADPLPAPPPEIAKDVLRLVVPVRFTLR